MSMDYASLRALQTFEDNQASFTEILDSYLSYKKEFAMKKFDNTFRSLVGE